MEVFIDFLIQNYLWVLVVFLIIVFALIGYLVDSGEAKKKTKIKPIHREVSSNDVKVHPSLEAYTNEDFDEPLMK